MQGKLILEDGTELHGKSFGYEDAVAGEVVFTTGMMGYPESLTDPSYSGQIMVCTYPLVGNYGVPDKEDWESYKVHATALIVSTYNDTPSHFQSKQTLSEWLKEQKVPALEIKDTRALTLKLREKGVMLGKIIFDKDIPLADPNVENLVANVSTKEIIEMGDGEKVIIAYDCGIKYNTPRNFIKRGAKLIIVPWDFNPFSPESIALLKSKGYKIKKKTELPFDGLFVSNGPGDPKMATKTIDVLKEALKKEIPIFGICLGNQLLALAAGGDTYKLKFGHRSQNQPCTLVGTQRCYLTTQNHGFAVGKIPKGFKPWFVNANDGTNEGIIHETKPFMSVQFHPEAAAGPVDTEWLFDYFLDKIK